MFKNPFSFTGRIRRSEYCISLIIYILFLSIFSQIALDSEEYYILLIPMIWFLWAQGAKRCHDRSNSGWYQIIPFYFLWMLFGSGDCVTNEYGVNPRV